MLKTLNPKKLLLGAAFLSLLAVTWRAGQTAQATLQKGQWADYVERGNQAVEQKNYPAAFSLYNKALQINPNLPISAKANLGELYLNAGQLEKARQYLEGALKSSPDQPKAQQLLSAIKLSQKTTASNQSITQKAKIAFDFLKKDQPYLALPILENITQNAPNYRDGHYLLSATYLKIGQTKKGQTAINKALEIDPNFAAGKELKEKIVQRLNS